MRQLYTSPRAENIDRVVALLAEHGIETTVANRSNWNKPTYQRFSYSQRQDDRDSWAQVWVTRADDFAKARGLLREVGIEPMVRHAEELAASRAPASPEMKRRHVATRVRRIVLVAIAGAFAILMMRYMGLI